MPDLLIELFSEEIPARMQRKAAGDLRKLVTDALVGAGLTYEGAKEYWTPRRLALDIRGLTARSADISEEKKGPRVGAPEQAVQGFLRSAGLASIEQAQIVSDPKKGEFYVAIVEKPGRPAQDIVAQALPAIIRDFPWPKSMRWGEASREPGSLRWVRPLKSILCTFGPETEEPEVIPFEVDGIRAGNLTFGHRFLAPQAIEVRRFDDYAAKLEAAKVVLDAERRKQIVLHDARNLAFAQGYELVEDEGLLEEVANLVEWPVVVMGSFEEDFLALPDEVTRLTIRENQKCFVLREGDSLINKFMLVSNIVPSDGGAEIARGNAKVVRARLSDAKFFWESDLQVARSPGGFDRWIANLDNVTFHAKLGSQGERVKRIEALAREIAPLVGADPDAAARAARLAKADLQSAMVFEFPELQGRMGRLYAEAAGEEEAVARAIEEHYSPLGPSDDVPTSPVSVAVALADKLDTLTGFWAIDEKPTGSKDPYALRRAALGVIRLVLENGVRMRFADAVTFALSTLTYHGLRPEHGYESLARRFDPSVEEQPYPNWSDEPYRSIFNADKFIDLHSEAIGMAQSMHPDLGGGPEDVKKGEEREERFNNLAVRCEELDQLESLIIFSSFDVGTKGILIELENDEYREYKNRLIKINWAARWIGCIVADLLSFFHDRLKVFLRDTGARHDLIDAVLGNPAAEEAAGADAPRPRSGGEAARVSANNDDIVLIVTKVRALQKLVESEDGANLLAGYKRAANILAAEAKKGTRVAQSVSADLLSQPQERTLLAAVEKAEGEAAAALEREDFEAAMGALAALRAPLDAFFDAVLVNDPDEAVRANRLALLERIRAATARVADFSRIGG